VNAKRAQCASGKTLSLAHFEHSLTISRTALNQIHDQIHDLRPTIRAAFIKRRREHELALIGPDSVNEGLAQFFGNLTENPPLKVAPKICAWPLRIAGELDNLVNGYQKTIGSL
jgi:hypothetical protein